MATDNLTKAQQKMKSWYDRWAEPKVFSPGDQVLALLPIANSPFLAKYIGPYRVVWQVSGTCQAPPPLPFSCIIASPLQVG